VVRDSDKKQRGKGREEGENEKGDQRVGSEMPIDGWKAELGSIQVGLGKVFASKETLLVVVLRLRSEIKIRDQDQRSEIEKEGEGRRGFSKPFRLRKEMGEWP